ncbi:MAG: flippase-like domain-containing protein [Deltaproteobacteria bacterium]|nr:MAG: flippase-like domain-containing protein [Deltaproteobacteria bacterium]
MKILQSKWFHWILGICGVGGSLFFLIHLSSWSQLFWPGAWFVFLLVGVVGLEMICRALRLQKVCELMASKRLSFRGSFWVGAIADIYGAATPSSVGGEVARLASLARFGIKGRESLMALALDRLVLLSSLLFVLLVSGGMVFLKDTSLFSLKSLLNTLILYFVLAGGLIVFLFIMVRREQYEMPWKKYF